MMDFQTPKGNKEMSCNCNQKIQVKYKKLVPEAFTPYRATDHAAGFDLTAIQSERSNGKVVYRTGLAFEIPPGYYGQFCPRSSIRDKFLNIMERQRLTIAETELSDQLGRPPSVMELADYTHTPVKRITAIRAARMAVPESKTFDPETGSPTISQRENAQEVWSQYVYQSLDPTNQRIFEMVTGYGGTKTVPKQEIAKKLRISPSAVSQRIGVITKKLEEGLNLE